MPKRTLIQTIPRVPRNLPLFFEAVVYDVLNSRRLGAGSQNHLVERQPREGLSAILEMVAERPAMIVTAIVELIPLANSVEVYLDTGMSCKGVLRLMRGLTEKMFDQIIGREISDSVGRRLALESQNYGWPSQGTNNTQAGASQITPQTSTPIETPPEAVIYCPACGFPNLGHARFCESCGTKFA